MPEIKLPKTIPFDFVQTNYALYDIKLIFSCAKFIQQYVSTNFGDLKETFTPKVLTFYFENWVKSIAGENEPLKFFATEINGSDVICHFLYRDWLRENLKNVSIEENYINLSINLRFNLPIPKLLQRYAQIITLQDFLQKKIILLINKIYLTKKIYKVSELLQNFEFKYLLFEYNLQKNVFVLKINAPLIFVNGILLSQIIQTFSKDIKVEKIKELINLGTNSSEVVLLATTSLVFLIKDISKKLYNEFLKNELNYEI